jgi:putative transposase
VALMRQLFDEADGNYGVPRMYKALRHAGLVVNRKRVTRLMRLHGMAGRHRRRTCRTTFPGPDGYHIPDLVERRFAPGAPDVAWCQDITYIPTREGWLYLASVLDLGSRRLLGYSMADHMRTELVLNALTMAVGARGGDHAVAGVIAHADRGSLMSCTTVRLRAGLRLTWTWTVSVMYESVLRHPDSHTAVTWAGYIGAWRVSDVAEGDRRG